MGLPFPRQAVAPSGTVGICLLFPGKSKSIKIRSIETRRYIRGCEFCKGDRKGSVIGSITLQSAANGVRGLTHVTLLRRDIGRAHFSQVGHKDDAGDEKKQAHPRPLLTLPFHRFIPTSALMRSGARARRGFRSRIGGLVGLSCHLLLFVSGQVVPSLSVARPVNSERQ